MFLVAAISVAAFVLLTLVGLLSAVAATLGRCPRLTAPYLRLDAALSRADDRFRKFSGGQL